MKHIVTIFLCLLLICFAEAQVPNKISYQGLLTTPSGTPMQDGSYDLKFEIFNLPLGGTLRHTETHSGVTVERGTFSLNLGPLPAIFSESLFVEVTVLAGPGISSSMTFAPRSELTSAPYALHTQLADTAKYALNVPPTQWTTSGSNIYYNSGNVGIGTTSPSYKLHVEESNASDNGLLINVNNTSTSTNSFAQFHAVAGGGVIAAAFYADGLGTGPLATVGGFFGTQTNHPVGLATNNIERVRITNSGNVGIGTTTPNYNLDVWADDATTNNITHVVNLVHNTTGTAANNIGVGLQFSAERTNGTQNVGLAYIDGIMTDATNVSSAMTFSTRINAGSITEKMRITESGNVGIGTTTPDANAKLDVNGYAFSKAPVVVYDSAAGSGTSFDITWLNDVRVDNNIVEKQTNKSDFKLKKSGSYRITCNIMLQGANNGGYFLSCLKNGVAQKMLDRSLSATDGFVILHGTFVVSVNANDVVNFPVWNIDPYAFSISSTGGYNTYMQLSIEYLGAE